MKGARGEREPNPPGGRDIRARRELAVRLGVSRNFINDRYGSKVAFWRAVVDSALRSRSAGLPQVDDSADDAERLRRIIAGFCRGAVGLLVGRIFVDEFSRGTERLDCLYGCRVLYECCVAPMPRTMSAYIERLVAEGRMAPVPMDVLFFAVIPPVAGMVEGPLARRLGGPGAASPKQLTDTADSLAALVVNGLLATGSGKRSRV
ncbi:TetR/AcrR family transcriptional regulator [Streptomyces sp. NPDC002643]